MQIRRCGGAGRWERPANSGDGSECMPETRRARHNIQLLPPDAGTTARSRLQVLQRVHGLYEAAFQACGYALCTRYTAAAGCHIYIYRLCCQLTHAGAEPAAITPPTLSDRSSAAALTRASPYGHITCNMTGLNPPLKGHRAPWLPHGLHAGQPPRLTAGGQQQHPCRRAPCVCERRASRGPWVVGWHALPACLACEDGSFKYAQ